MSSKIAGKKVVIVAAGQSKPVLIFVLLSVAVSVFGISEKEGVRVVYRLLLPHTCEEYPEPITVICLVFVT